MRRSICPLRFDLNTYTKDFKLKKKEKKKRKLNELYKRAQETKTIQYILQTR